MTTKAAFAPKYKLIYDQLRSSILAGSYGPGDRLPTEVALVERFGASRTTVIRALRELEHSGLLRRRQGSGSYATAKPPVQRQLFGLIVPSMGGEQRSDSIFYKIYDDLASMAHHRGAAILFGARADTGEDSPGRLLSVVEQMIAHKVTGVFYVPQSIRGALGEVNLQVTRLLTNRGISIVLLDRDIYEFPRRSKFDLVSVDNQCGGYLLGVHLAEVGCKRIAFIGGPTASTITARAMGITLALEERGLSLNKKWGSLSSEPSLQTMRQLLAEAKPDAIVCDHDALAARIMRHVLALGIRIPHDLKIVGFDDSAASPLLPVPLTTVRQPTRALASFAIRAMLDRVEDTNLPERQILVGGELVIRQSSSLEAI
ncbi:MAG: LacI family DNA-binding transcriptional regulator [Phycisphaerae bacterium]|nr:LacI family DNA-binding transcriptional regulator [Phycisphaerae bacterium]